MGTTVVFDDDPRPWGVNENESTGDTAVATLEAGAPVLDDDLDDWGGDRPKDDSSH